LAFIIRLFHDAQSFECQTPYDYTPAILNKIVYRNLFDRL